MRTDREEVRRALAFVDDPVQRTKQQIERGLLDDAEASLIELLDSGTVYFQHHDRGTGIPEVVKVRPATTFVVIIAEKARIDLAHLKQKMRWNAATLLSFVEKIFERVVRVDPTQLKAQIASWAGSWEINATARAMERYLKKGHSMRQVVMRWCLRAHLNDDVWIWSHTTPAWRKQWLGDKLEVGWGVFRSDSWRKIGAEMTWSIKVGDAIVDALEKLGMTREEVRADMLAWIRKQVRKGLNWNLYVCVVGCKIWRHDDVDRAEALAPLVSGRLFGAEFDSCTTCHPVVLAKLIDCGLLKHEGSLDVAKAGFTAQMVRLLVAGKMGQVVEANELVGVQIFGTDKGEFHVSRRAPSFQLASVAAEAFDVAWEAGEYGIAATIAVQFGPGACLDKELLRPKAEAVRAAEGGKLATVLKELVEERKTQIDSAVTIARASGKPTGFDYSLVYTPRA